MKYIACAIYLLAATGANSGFLENRGDWNDQNELAKLGYVMGAADRHLMVLGGGEHTSSNARVLRQLSCLGELDVDSSDLLQLVEEFYSDIEKWSWPPSAVTMGVIFQLCGL